MDAVTSFVLSPQVFGYLAYIFVDHLVSRFHDVARGAVVLLQLKGFELGIILLQVKNIL